MTFSATLQDADGVELFPALRASIDQGPNGWQGSLTLPPGKTEGILRVLNDSGDPNYYYRLVATDGRAVRIRFGGSRTVDASSGTTVVEFVAEGPLTEPPART